MNNKKENKPNGYWTYEKCAEVIKDCTSISGLREKNDTVYRLVIKNKWFELTDHLERKCVSKNYWTKEKCHEITKMFNTRKELCENYKSVYYLILKRGWDELFDHMNRIIKPNGYWKKYENCKEVALLHTKISEFRIKYPTAYEKILEYRWDDLLDHMELQGNKYKRLIYVYIFPDNHFYVGLTCNKKERNRIHKKSGTVYKHRIKTGLEPEYIILTDYVDVKEAKNLEEFYRLEYINKGYIELNKIKTGGLGGNLSAKVWDFESIKNKIIEEGIKLRVELKNKDSSAYKAALKNEWMDIFFPDSKPKAGVKWTYDLAKEHFKTNKYKNRSDFFNRYPSFYQKCRKSRWLENFFPIKIWNYESAKEFINSIRDSCDSRTKFHKQHNTLYEICRENNWLEDFFPLETTKWSYENVKNFLIKTKVKNRSEFKKKYCGAYNYCLKNNLLDQLFPKTN